MALLHHPFVQLFAVRREPFDGPIKDARWRNLTRRDFNDSHRSEPFLLFSNRLI
jgi:hypothetical protein